MTHTEDLIARLRDTASRGVLSWGDPSHDDEDLMKAIEQSLKDKNI